MSKYTMIRKAQHSVETILVVVVLALFFFFGVWFYAQATNISLEEQERELSQEKLFSLALQLSHLPELSCTSQGAETRTCFDQIKLELFSEWLNNPNSPQYDDQILLRYVDMFGKVRIMVQTVYPEVENQILILDTTISEDILVQSFPIIIHDPLTDTHKLGLIVVGKE